MTYQQQINKNRDEIDRLLNSSLPLNMIYNRINILSESNKRLIKKIKDESI